MVLGAMIMLGVSLALLARSPFRAPVGERLFRLVWLGPLGRAFVSFASRRGPRREDAPVRTGRSSRAATSSSEPALAPVAKKMPPDARLVELEARVVELERWRKTTTL
jgi:hypothetical protein